MKTSAKNNLTATENADLVNYLVVERELTSAEATQVVTGFVPERRQDLFDEFMNYLREERHDLWEIADPFPCND